LASPALLHLTEEIESPRRSPCSPSSPTQTGHFPRPAGRWGLQQAWDLRQEPAVAEEAPPPSFGSRSSNTSSAPWSISRTRWSPAKPAFSCPPGPLRPASAWISCAAWPGRGRAAAARSGRFAGDSRRRAARRARDRYGAQTCAENPPRRGADSSGAVAGDSDPPSRRAHARPRPVASKPGSGHRQPCRAIAFFAKPRSRKAAIAPHSHSSTNSPSGAPPGAAESMPELSCSPPEPLSETAPFRCCAVCSARNAEKAGWVAVTTSGGSKPRVAQPSA
jgi:hypothetical protein